MSWLFGNQADKNEEGMGDQEFRAIEINHTAHLGMFRSALTLCEKSCVDNGESIRYEYLSRREAVCVDRCIGKFFNMIPKINALCEEHQKAKMGTN